jgi:hypothetical protein
MAILIDSQGLIRGRRLRKLSSKARLLYPFLLGMTNFYGRIELDAEAISNDLRLLKDDTLDEGKVAEIFSEFCKANLAVEYAGKSTTWIQFDTPLRFRAEYPTSADNASPAPPEPTYTEWLQALHGDDWQEYNLSSYQQTLSEKRSDAGRKGGIASGASRKQNEANGSNPNGAPANEPVIVGVVEGVEEVVGEEVVVNFNAKAETEAEKLAETKSSKTPPLSNGNETEPSLYDVPLSSDSDSCPATTFAEVWMRLMPHNTHRKQSAPARNWKSFLIKDFTELLARYTPDELHERLAFSQFAPAQSAFNQTTKNLLTNRDTVEDVFAKVRRKPEVWGSVWSRYQAVLAGEEPVTEVQEGSAAAPDREWFPRCDECGKRTDVQAYADLPLEESCQCGVEEHLQRLEAKANAKHSKRKPSFNYDEDDGDDLV